MKNRLVDDSEVKYVAADVSGAGVFHHDREEDDKFELVFQEEDDCLTVIMDVETLSRVMLEALNWRRTRELRQEVVVAHEKGN